MSDFDVPADEASLESFLNSSARLAAVRNTGLLDSPPEECFDSMTRLAVRLLRVPLAYVTAIDADRDYFKSHCGFPEPLASERVLTGRTFCHYAAMHGSLLAIEDTHAHPVWREVPSVRSHGVRAFMGMPLTLNGQRVGNFCVAELGPRRWSDEDRATLEALARSTERELALRAALVRSRAQTSHVEALARSKEELIAVIGHDLRNPLQVLDLTLNLLSRIGAEEREAAIARASGAVLAMRRITDALLSENDPDTARTEILGSVSSSKVLSNVSEMMAPIAERKDIKLALECADDSTIAADFGQMLRVFSNLIGNAIKYSPPGTTIRVGSRTENDAVVFEVIDEGPGMSATEQHRAFDRGWQGTSGTTSAGGHGLGLAIVKQIVEQHNGNVAVESTLGRGSRFKVTLPVFRAE